MKAKNYLLSILAFLSVINYANAADDRKCLTHLAEEGRKRRENIIPHGFKSKPEITFSTLKAILALPIGTQKLALDDTTHNKQDLLPKPESPYTAILVTGDNIYEYFSPSLSTPRQLQETDKISCISKNKVEVMDNYIRQFYFKVLRDAELIHVFVIQSTPKDKWGTPEQKNVKYAANELLTGWMKTYNYLQTLPTKTPQIRRSRSFNNILTPNETTILSPTSSLPTSVTKPFLKKDTKAGSYYGSSKPKTPKKLTTHVRERSNSDTGPLSREVIEELMKEQKKKQQEQK